MKKNRKQKLYDDELYELSDKDKMRFALFCIDQVRHIWKDSTLCVETYQLLKLWLEDAATMEQCRQTGYDIYDYCNQPYSASRGMRSDLIYACRSFIYAANIVEGSPSVELHARLVSSNVVMAISFGDTLGINVARIRRQQRKYLNELRYIDNIFEKIVLKG